MKVGDLVKYKFDTDRSKTYLVVTLDSQIQTDRVFVTLHGWTEPNAVGLPQKFWVDHLEVISASR